MIDWLNSRLHLHYLLTYLSNKNVPQHKYSYWYIFGGLTLFFFLIQISTGVLLLLYYSPTSDTAYESVQFIIEKVPFGWLIRSLHNWSAHLMIACVFIHLFSVYFMKAYRAPREMLWYSGVILLFIVLGFAFTGYLLPWDTTSYFATQIGTEIPRSIPFVGDLMVDLLRGGDYIAEESLKRLFALHVTILPLISMMLIAFHLILNQIHSVSTPRGIVVKDEGMPFYPNYIQKEFIIWLTGAGILSIFALLYPIHLGTKADPFASAPYGIKPEWYFLTLYQTLRFFPPKILNINSDLVVNILVIALSMIILIIPILDKNSSRVLRSRLFTWLGVSAILYLVVTIILAYLT